ncbi:polysaccharide deacetylase family protein [Anderseniella sp. Alg231-50]|uniref:polysaccharide deacetylase family protein n=1 Tax=Anderseniella sp. Alg231-50 TaxID=1922226 RepID=UPI000D55D5CA
MSHPELEFELQNWRGAGKPPQVWWRDDDAVSATPRLDRLTQVTGEAGVEVLLAVIPAHADQSLADHVAQNGNLTPCVHGWSHTNHAPAGEKKCELGDHRALDTVLSDISRGRQQLARLFGSRLAPVLVPPWNRMRGDLAPHLGEIGIDAFSTFAHKRTLPAIQANTHVDVMDWKAAGGAAGKEQDRILSELAAALGVSRANGFYPVGLLTHHLVHDDAAWSALGGVLAHPGLNWVPFADTLDHHPRTTS